MQRVGYRRAVPVRSGYLRAAAPAADPGKVTKQLSCVMEPSEPMAVTGSMSIQVRAM